MRYRMGYMMITPLVNSQFAIEHGHRNSWFRHEIWLFSIVFVWVRCINLQKKYESLIKNKRHIAVPIIINVKRMIMVCFHKPRCCVLRFPQFENIPSNVRFQYYYYYYDSFHELFFSFICVKNYAPPSQSHVTWSNTYDQHERPISGRSHRDANPVSNFVSNSVDHILSHIKPPRLYKYIYLYIYIYIYLFYLFIYLFMYVFISPSFDR